MSTFEHTLNQSKCQCIKATLKQCSQRRLLRVDTLKNPCLKARLEQCTANVTVLRSRWQIVPHSWRQWMETVWSEPRSARTWHDQVIVVCRHELRWSELNIRKQLEYSDPWPRTQSNAIGTILYTMRWSTGTQCSSSLIVVLLRITADTLQTQDRLPQSRPVASRNQSQTHSDATGLNCGFEMQTSYQLCIALPAVDGRLLQWHRIAEHCSSPHHLWRNHGQWCEVFTRISYCAMRANAHVSAVYSAACHQALFLVRT